jgi:hypothetical protein
MKLSKKIPAKTKTVRFEWAYTHFLQFSENYVKARSRFRSKLDHCDWCKKKFEFGEWFALACPKPRQEGPKRNWFLCHDCAESMGAKRRPEA